MVSQTPGNSQPKTQHVGCQSAAEQPFWEPCVQPCTGSGCLDPGTHQQRPEQQNQHSSPTAASLTSSLGQ